MFSNMDHMLKKENVTSLFVWRDREPISLLYFVPSEKDEHKFIVYVGTIDNESDEVKLLSMGVWSTTIGDKHVWHKLFKIQAKCHISLYY